MDNDRASKLEVLRSWMTSAAQVYQLVAAATALYSSTTYWTQQYHTSALTGQMWVDKLLNGHPDRIHTELGVRLHVFIRLVVDLRAMGCHDGRDITVEQQLAIFLYTCVTGLSARHVGERFQHSHTTITKYFVKILDYFAAPAFFNLHVRLPSAHDPVPLAIRNNPKFWPYFKDCIGAMDGTHIACWSPAEDHGNMRNRKGFLSQNVLAVCNFDMFFVYILAGWDGFVTDSFLYSDARVNDLPVPPGRYYLGDAGFPLCANVLIPYRSTRYHLREWALGNQKPQKKEELFNLRHAQLRNIVERIFGVEKNRWKILIIPVHYAMSIQAKIPAALAALHNYIREFDPMEEEDLLAFDPVPGIRPGFDPTVHGQLAETHLTDNESEEGNELRESIANAMWADYLNYLERQGNDSEA